QQQQQQDSENQPQETPENQNEMTVEQAERLLEAIADESQTLQERLQRIIVSSDPVPTQDW
ncbi:MAG: hypothetical protein AAF629_35430, partial [Chloroflexota bacterium]